MVLGTVLLCWLVLWPTWIWCGSDNTCQCRWCGHAVPRYVFRPVTVSRPVTFSRCGDPCYGQQVTHASPSEPERWAFVLTAHVLMAHVWQTHLSPPRCCKREDGGLRHHVSPPLAPVSAAAAAWVLLRHRPLLPATQAESSFTAGRVIRLLGNWEKNLSPSKR
jgi:hypothetical protein